MKKSLLYINNFEAPYRVPFFEMLNQEYNMTLALSQHPKDRKERNPAWFQQGSRTYDTVYLKTVNVMGAQVGFQIRDMLPKYDIVFMDMYANPTNMYAIYCLNKAKRRFVMSVDGMLAKEKQPFPIRFLKKYFLNSPVKILSPGTSVDHCLESYGVSSDKLVRYHFTSLLNTDILASVPSPSEKATLREKLEMKEKRIALSVGRTIHGKGFDVLIKASREVSSDIGFYIVGGAPSEECSALLRAYHIQNIHFIDFKSKAELNNYYKAADVFILPTRSDVWGLVVNEAMACALPVITTEKCGAGLELVENGVNGYLVPVDNEKALADCIQMFFNTPGVPQKMSAASLAKIRPYNIENMAVEHIRLIEKILCE